MKMRVLGATGLRVSRIGLGLAALGRPAYMTLGRDRDLGADRSPDALERRCHALLDAAYAAGIRYVDAARSYGSAECFLARWLARNPDAAADLIAGSKWGYEYVGGWRLDAPIHEVKDLSARTLQRQWNESVAILGTHLSLYQIHSATIESGVFDDAEVITTLARLRSSGVSVGLTATGPRQADTIRRALALRVDGVRLFDVVQATWNLLEPSAGAALAEAHAAGAGVIAKETLANGRLMNPRDDEHVAVLAEDAARRGLALDTLCLAAALAQPWADVVLSGAVTRDQLRSHVAAAGVHLSAGDLPSIARDPAEYWQERSRLAWA